jgi:hypothetical protein
VKGQAAQTLVSVWIPAGKSTAGKEGSRRKARVIAILAEEMAFLSSED